MKKTKLQSFVTFFLMLTLASSSFLFITNANTTAYAQLQDLIMMQNQHLQQHSIEQQYIPHPQQSETQQHPFFGQMSVIEQQRQQQSLQNQPYQQQSQQPFIPNTNIQMQLLQPVQQLPLQEQQQPFLSSSTPYYTNEINSQALGSLINLSNNPGDSIFPKVAVSGNNVHVVWEDYSRGAAEILYTNSVDGGKTFGNAVPLDGREGRSYHPSIAVSGNNVYFVWVYYTPSPDFYEIMYSKSIDGGKTLGNAISIAGSSEHMEKPSITVSGNDVHIAWTDLLNGDAQIHYAKSINGGFFNVKSLTNTAGGATYPSIAAYGGNVHVVWREGTGSPISYEINYIKSSDYGNSFSPPKNLSNNAGWSMYPSVLVPDGNSVFVTWADVTSGNWEIYYTKSINGGLSFSPFKNLSNSPGGSGNPSITTSDGLIYVVWNEDNDISFIKSYDYGETFGNPINLSANPLTGSSYVTIAAAIGQNVHSVWTEANQNNGKMDIQYRKDYLPTASIYINGIAPKKPSTTFTIQGYLKDAYSGSALPGKTITFTGSTGLTSTPSPVTTASDGTFRATATTSSNEGKYWIRAQFAGDSTYPPTTGQRSFIIDKTVPEVRITSPANGATFSAPATVVVKAEAKDKLLSTDTTYTGKIRNVEFLFKKSTDTTYTVIRTDTVAPYDAQKSSLSSGSYNFIARAYDEAGNRKTSSTVTVSVR